MCSPYIGCCRRARAVVEGAVVEGQRFAGGRTLVHCVRIPGSISAIPPMPTQLLAACSLDVNQDLFLLSKLPQNTWA
jgi:hypothetical protein